jgi:hypothetical protein
MLDIHAKMLFVASGVTATQQSTQRVMRAAQPIMRSDLRTERVRFVAPLDARPVAS